MSDSRAQQIVVKMQTLRARGTRVAEHFPNDIRRARDWREYVRAMPLPSAFAAAAIGFLVTYARAAPKQKSMSSEQGVTHPNRLSDLAALGTGAPDQKSAVPARSRSAARSRSTAWAKGAAQAAVSWAGAYAVSQVTQFARTLALQQLHTFKDRLGTDVHRRQFERENAASTSRPGEQPASPRPSAEPPGSEYRFGHGPSARGQ
jgi:hypothetical protein